MAIPDFFENIAEKVKCPSGFTAKSRVAVTLCVTVCAASAVITYYIGFGFTQTNELRSAEYLQEKLGCLSDDLGQDEYVACEKKYGVSKLRQDDMLPTECIHENLVIEEIQKVRSLLFSGPMAHHMHIACTPDKIVLKIKETKVPEEQYTELERATGMCYSNQDRFIVHWFAQEDAGTGIIAHQWHHVAHLISDRSVYTVSPGHHDTFVNGAVKIFKDGLYLVYAKVVVKCTKADKQSKRVFFEVRMNEHYGDHNWETTLLRDVGQGVCNLEGDLLTLFQQGLIRMSKNALVYVRVKLPENVTLSDDNSIYKTNIGVSWVGLS